MLCYNDYGDNMSKKKKYVLIICILLLAFGAFYIINKHDIRYIKDKVYCCNNGDCIIYNGKKLKLYTSDVNSKKYLDNFVSSCEYTRFKNECGLNIVKWTKEYLFIKQDNNIYFYHNKTDKYPTQKISAKLRKKELNLKDLFYTNGDVELYFKDDKTLIRAGKDIPQKEEDYTFTNKADEYYNFYTTSSDEYETSNYQDSFTYNSKTKEIIGFKKKNIKNAKYIAIK